jgi:hypothetical protein
MNVDASHFAAVYFREYIDRTFGTRPTIHSYLLHHERRQRCLDGICQQIRIAESHRIAKGLNLGRIRMLAETGAKIFCDLALRLAEQSALSNAERQRQINEAAKIETLRDDLIDRDIILNPQEIKQ